MVRKPAMDAYVNAILDRDQGVPYALALQRWGITPNQFFRAVSRDLDDFVRLTEGEVNQTLRAIAENRQRTQELFNMGEQFIREQYNRIQAGKQNKLYFGTFKHQENIDNLIYYALTKDRPQLAARDRTTVIDAIKKLPKDLVGYMYPLGLQGVMVGAFPKGKRGSPFAVIERFDKLYQLKTGDVSLFDLEQPQHLHPWGEEFKTPKSYLKNREHLETAVYHTLVEHHPELASQDRKTVIEAIKALPKNRVDHFNSIGLGGLAMEAFPKGKQNSPLAVLRVFDKVYQEKTGHPSLFHTSQSLHLRIDGANRVQ